nr:tRNA lysidine(34) synthetase TilS [Oleiagrimonas sp. C23AA]
MTDHLSKALAERPAGALCVAFSAGPDSSALLHALTTLPQARARGLRAVHVDHGLHADSASWAEHARQRCEQWNVPLKVLRVQVHAQGQGIEAAAREARYGVLAATLHQCETLLTAQHADDQAETVLLKALRGAGPHGLAGMRGERALGAGQLWRPLLAVPRGVLTRYVQMHQLECIDDPANRSEHHARSFLRQAVMPKLARHWPRAATTLGHTAALQADVADYLDGQAQAAWHALLAADGSLAAPGWRALHPALRGLVLERWLHDRRLPAPTQAQRQELERQIDTAGADRNPRIAWPGAQMRLWRQRMYALPILPPLPKDWTSDWTEDALALPGLAGTLCWNASPSAAPDLTVRLDVPGAQIKPAGDRHTRDVRDLYQRAGIPPWRRRHCPFLFDPGGTLLAVADLWASTEAEALYAQCGARPVWHCTL